MRKFPGAAALRIAVSGPGGQAGDELQGLAGEVGVLLAHAGAIVMTGGLDGVMAAVALGARGAGGTVVGLLPGDDTDEANEHLDLALPTGLGQLRNALLVTASDGLISVGGSWGTLSEIALARRAGKPVVCLRGWIVTTADGDRQPLPVAGTAAEAVSRLLSAIAQAPASPTGGGGYGPAPR